jgi:hypothetical protein
MFFLLALLFCFCGSVNAQNVPDQYKKYFFKFEDNRSVMEKVLNAAGLSNEDVGRSFALICGISEYPKMGALEERTLAPAAEDIRKMKKYLQQNDFFDEIVVLENSDVTLENFQYFLQSYFPARLKKFPKSRFLFAYSGHGMTENNKGYLLESTADSLSDKAHAINLDVLHVYLNEAVSVGHHVLVLLNSCYGGSLLKRSYGAEKLIPKYPGAHAITAGSSGELTWHDAALGNGSVFYEKIIAGLGGIADTHTDGIITAHELAAYLIDEIRTFSNQRQNPQCGDISLNGSQGEFFFLNKNRPIIQKSVAGFNPNGSMGITPRLGNDNDEDRHDWEMLSKLGAEGLRAYIDKHPNGKWAGEARTRIDRLQPKAVLKRTLPQEEKDRLEAEWQREQHANSSSTALNRTVSKEEQDQIDDEWQKIQGAGTSHTIEGFLRMYPVGSHVPAVQQRLSDLRAVGR